MVDFVRSIEVLAGVEPSTDATPQATPHYTFADKIRFVEGRPRKIKGWTQILIEALASVSGVVRNIYSYYAFTSIQYLIATNSHLYHLVGATLTNITPLETTATPIPDSLDTYYISLGSNPIATVDGSNVITITDTATRVRSGDTIVLSGSTTVNGIPDTEINSTLFVREQTTDSFTVQVSSDATSTGSGGGASVELATAIIIVNQTAHGNADGDRIKITGAATTGGIPDSEINAEHIIRNVSADTMDIVVTTQATSSVSGGGGSGTEIQEQIEPGPIDANFGTGYGLGEYGVGLYGVPKMSSFLSLPRIWSIDRYGTDIILTPGSQTGVYIWDNDINVAPVLLTNAPTAVDYVYVANQIVVTLGEGDTPNRIKSSDNVDITDWTGTATNQAYENDIAESTRWVSQCPSRGLGLLFTDTQVFTIRYINRPGIWDVQLLDNTSGIIAQNARVAHNGVVYWMGNKNFYMYQGGNVEIIPSNSRKESTIKDYVFNDLNYAQKSKSFAWFNEEFNEVWFHYPSASSNECDRIARINILEFTHTPDTMDRTAAEYPSIQDRFPYLASLDGTLYQHEVGNDDNTEPLGFTLRTPMYRADQDRADLKGIIPDSIQDGAISVTLNTKNYPQGNIATYGPYEIQENTNAINYETSGHYWQYEISGEELGQEWRGGNWLEILAKGSKQ